MNLRDLTGVVLSVCWMTVKVSAHADSIRTLQNMDGRGLPLLLHASLGQNATFSKTENLKFNIQYVLFLIIHHL